MNAFTECPLSNRSEMARTSPKEQASLSRDPADRDADSGMALVGQRHKGSAAATPSMIVRPRPAACRLRLRVPGSSLLIRGPGTQGTAVLACYSASHTTKYLPLRACPQTGHDCDGVVSYAHRHDASCPSQNPLQDTQASPCHPEPHAIFGIFRTTPKADGDQGVQKVIRRPHDSGQQRKSPTGLPSSWRGLGSDGSSHHTT